MTRLIRFAKDSGCMVIIYGTTTERVVELFTHPAVEDCSKIGAENAIPYFIFPVVRSTSCKISAVFLIYKLVLFCKDNEVAEMARRAGENSPMAWFSDTRFHFATSPDRLRRNFQGVLNEVLRNVNAGQKPYVHN